MWTPRFPRIAGADTSRNGLSLYALDVAHVVEGPDVVFTVSLFYGNGMQQRVRVADVRATPEQPVRVEQLRAYGVEPVTLSLMVVPPTLAYPTAVISKKSVAGWRGYRCTRRPKVTSRTPGATAILRLCAFSPCGFSLCPILCPRPVRNAVKWSHLPSRRTSQFPRKIGLGSTW